MSLKGSTKQFCKRGHDTFIVGRDKSGRCRECNRIRQRQYDHEEPKVKDQKKIEKKQILLKYLEKGTKICSKCKIEKSLDQFSPDKKRFLGVASYCKDCNSKLSVDWKHRNREKHNAQGRKWHKDNSEHSRANGKRWREENKEHCILKGKLWRQNNKARRSHNEAKRRMRGKVHFGQKGIINFYKDKPKGMEVDHIVPLLGDEVSGLHVSWNLQYLPSKVNRIKHNKIDLLVASEWYGKILEEAGLK